MKGKCSQKSNKLLVAVICAVLFAVVTTVIIVALLNEKTLKDSGIGPLAINDMITGQDSLEINNESIEELPNTMIPKSKGTEAVEAYSLDTEQAESIQEDTEVMVNDPAVLTLDFEALKAKDEETVKRYFGDSKTFSPDIIANKIAATKLTIISQETLDNETLNVVAHVCTLDYYKMQETSSTMTEELKNKGEENIEEAVKKEIAKMVVTGEFALHYSIPVIIQNGTVMVTEELKQAITGGWYKGLNTELKPIECPLEG